MGFSLLCPVASLVALLFCFFSFLSSLFSFLSPLFFFFSFLFSLLSSLFSLLSSLFCLVASLFALLLSPLSCLSLLFPASGAPCLLITCTALQPPGGNQVDGLPPVRHTGAAYIALNSVSRLFETFSVFFSLVSSIQ